MCLFRGIIIEKLLYLLTIDIATNTPRSQKITSYHLFFFLLIVPVSPSGLVLSLFCGCTTRGMFVLLGCWTAFWCWCCTEFALMTILGSIGLFDGGVATVGHTLLGTHGTTGDLCSSGMASGCGRLPSAAVVLPARVVQSFFRPRVDDILGGGGGGIFVPPSGMPANGGGSDSLFSAVELEVHWTGKSGNTFGKLNKHLHLQLLIHLLCTLSNLNFKRCNT